ncbi:rhodanese-like domain-containing protein [Halobacteriovorax sp.]|uniref:rhodanese-like domain-containing protein n=1 Tax=Halobacteriovorax sp. TaxID=2020862 RepID=UPI003AF222CC
MKEVLEIIRNNVLYVAIGLFFIWKFYKYFRTKKTLKEIVSKGNYQLVDVRSIGEFHSNSIPHSLNLPIDQISQGHMKIDKDKDIIIYCASGARSAMARLQLLKLGYKNIVNGGGIGHVSRIIEGALNEENHNM